MTYRAWTGSGWVPGIPKTWTGSTWAARMRTWNGTAWVPQPPLIPYQVQAWDRNAAASAGLTGTVAPSRTGDMLVLLFATGMNDLGAVTSVTGGGVSTWTRAAWRAGAWVALTEIWYGPVTAAGSQQLTLTVTGNPGANWYQTRIEQWSVSPPAPVDWQVIATSPNGASTPLQSNLAAGAAMQVPALAGTGTYLAVGGTYNSTPVLPADPGGFAFSIFNTRLRVSRIGVTDPAPPPAISPAAGQSWNAVAAMFTAQAA